MSGELPTEVDVLVVGGGIHGAGVAQAAAASGRGVLLVEERRLAAGTSSKSSKLIHGGLRYLESRQWSLVRESLAERAIMLAIAPHLVVRRDFLLPIYADARRGPWTMRAGLALYSLLAGFRPHTGFGSVPRRRWDELDGLATAGLVEVLRYCDACTDDAALVRAVAASARELGALVREGVPLVAARADGAGWIATLGGACQGAQVRAATIVNAAGPWVESVRARATPPPPEKKVSLVAGTHVELAGRLRHGPYYFEAIDGRGVFAIPWRGRTLFGTTEREHHGDPADVAPTSGEVDYLVREHARRFPGASGELLASWAGLRVLPSGGSMFDRKRETVYVVDDEARPRWLAIHGGKLTGWRAAAEAALGRLEPSLPPARRKADTRTLRLPPDPEGTRVELATGAGFDD